MDDTTETKRKAGRPPHEPTDEQRRIVLALVGYGMPMNDVAHTIGIDDNTLRRHYREELDRGIPIANAGVAKNLHKIAMGEGREAVTAAIFWLKCRAGWSEYSPPPKHGEDGATLGKKEMADLAAKTAEQGTGWAGLVH